MKKLFGLLALILGMVSCQTEPEGLDVIVGGEVESFVTVSIAETTRATSAHSGLANVNPDDYDLRYILEVYDKVNDVFVYRDVKTVETSVKSVSFPVRLIPERDYNFVVWADFVEDGEEGDLYYNTINNGNGTYGLNAVTIADGKWLAMDEARDAYTAVALVEKYNSGKSINLNLIRPFGKLRVVTTDIEALKKLAYDALPTDVRVEYKTKVSSGFNALTQTANTEVANATFAYNLANVYDYDDYVDANTTSLTLFTDYIFGTETGTIQFDMTVTYKNGNEATNSFNTEIPVKRNYLTTITGDILTDGNNIKVDVKDGFENGQNPNDPPYYQEAISSEAELIAAINGQGGEYIVVSDIVVTGNSASTLAATRATANEPTTSEPKTTTINLNGYTITLEADVEVKENTTLIIDNQPLNETGGDKGAIVSNGGQIVNNGNLNIEGGHFGENTIESTNGEVNITGGTFESNPSDFVDDDYIVVEGEDGEFTLEQKEEAVEINGTKYRSIKKAVAAAQNGETVKFILDVEQADGVIITDKNITIDLNDKTFTVSEGANTNNRNFKVNGSSVVTIKNGIMVAAGDYSSGAYGTLRTEGTANVTLEDVKLYNYRGNGLNVKAYAGTTVTITDAEVYSQYGGGIEAAGGSIELTNVKVEQKGMYTAPYNSMAISVNGGGTVTVNSGTYSTVCITAEEANNQGTSHGPWCAGVLNSGGTLIIKGGTFSNDNFGENTLAAHARGLLLADTAANIQIQGGTFNAVKAIVDIQNNLGDASKNPSATISGGDFSYDPRISASYSSNLITVAEGYVVDEIDGRYQVVKDVKVAKVGNTEYRKIDDAIAAWTNNSTLTLMSDVTLNDVITLKSTEHHILNLGTYTMTAAEGKNAFEILPMGVGTAARQCLTINAHTDNPGGITATGKSCIYYHNSEKINDRMTITINGGVFNGSYAINQLTGPTNSWGFVNSPLRGQGAAYCVINGGTFNAQVFINAGMLKVTGGVFHKNLTCYGDSTAYRLISGGRIKSMTMTADAEGKFTIGSNKSTYDVGVYVDKEGYLVVGGPVITEAPGENWEKKSYSSWSSYLKYSSAATYGLYFEK